MKALPLSPKITILSPGSVVYLSSSGGMREATVRSIKPIGRHLSISFLGVDDKEAALPYRDSFVMVRRESIPLGSGEFFFDELIGLSVLTTDGTVLGEVTDIIETGSNDVYVVRGSVREYLIPAIRDVVKGIDREGGKILIEVMEGLLD
jgi:16S rRNA processing protein RimM